MPNQVELSPLGLGCWQFGSAGSEDYWGVEFTDAMAVELVAQCVSAGMTYFDTAEDYAKGGSESQLGRALAALPPEVRAKVRIGSKILPNNCGNVRAHLEATLKRLGVQSIELYMVHWPISASSMSHFAGAHNAAGARDYAATGAVDESRIPSTQRTFEELKQLQDEGKIKHIGVSNFGVAQLTEALATGVTIASNELCYNLLTRAIETGILPFCRDKNIKVIAYSALLQGLLTSATDPFDADKVPTYRARSRHFACSRPKSRHGEAGHEVLLASTLGALHGLAKGWGMSLSDIAVAWLLAKPGIACVIVGVTKPSQLDRNRAPLPPRLHLRCAACAAQRVLNALHCNTLCSAAHSA
jgi:aryl-alcohol dehydrogenase-like predicted oxidoreductase